MLVHRTVQTAMRENITPRHVGLSLIELALVDVNHKHPKHGE
jgi:hypothetical protein